MLGTTNAHPFQYSAETPNKVTCAGNPCRVWRDGNKQHQHGERGASDLSITANTSPQTQQPKLLFVDVLNYTGSFFPWNKAGKWPSLARVRSNVREFVEGAKQAGWQLEVCILACTGA